jgi:hypothetical protein
MNLEVVVDIPLLFLFLHGALDVINDDFTIPSLTVGLIEKENPYDNMMLLVV